MDFDLILMFLSRHVRAIEDHLRLRTGAAVLKARHRRRIEAGSGAYHFPRSSSEWRILQTDRLAVQGGVKICLGQRAGGGQQPARQEKPGGEESVPG